IVTVTNLIKTPKPISFYPGTSGFYNLYIGTTKITTSSPAGLTILTGSQLSSGVTFTVPSLASGVYNISVTYAGQPVSSALSPLSTVDSLVVVSTAGTTISAGSLVTVPVYSSGKFAGYAIAAYGLDANVPANLWVYNSLGPNLVLTSTTGTYGEIFDPSDLSSSSPYYSSSSVGTFSVVLSLGTAPSASELYATYTVSGTLAFYSPSTAGSYTGPVFYDFINDVVTLTPTGLSAGTYYNLYFGTMYVETLSASSATAFVPNYPSSSPTEAAFTVPVVPPGLYYVNLTYAGTTKVVASEPFDVLPSYYGTLTVTSAQGVPTNYAFPGEIINFAWTPSVQPNAPGTVIVNSPTVGSFTYATIYVTVYLNNTAYTTLPATYSSGTLMGSFLAPNAAIGSYWNISLSWSQNVYTSSSPLVIGSPLSGATTQYNHTMAPFHDSYLGLIRGNGSLLTGISASEVATIEAQLTSAVTTSLQVPLSELKANVTALHGDIVQITTAFGNMTTTLKAINATVSTIESGQALIQSDLGTIKATLSSINASIVSLNNNVVTINTTLGKVTTSLSSINATVTSTASGVSSLQGSAVTIITDLGTFTGTVKSVSGGLATIQTSLGNLTTNVSQIKTNTGKINTISSSLGTTEIFEIVILVLVLITLVLSFLAINAANRVAKKVDEQKKQ
ncbi:MAG: hypothetical protein QW393_04330, partial [Candidatus Micrarchaeaceae archaeon]